MVTSPSLSELVRVIVLLFVSATANLAFTCFELNFRQTYIVLQGRYRIVSLLARFHACWPFIDPVKDWLLDARNSPSLTKVAWPCCNFSRRQFGAANLFIVMPFWRQPIGHLLDYKENDHAPYISPATEAEEALRQPAWQMLDSCQCAARRHAL